VIRIGILRASQLAAAATTNQSQPKAKVPNGSASLGTYEKDPNLVLDRLAKISLQGSLRVTLLFTSSLAHRKYHATAKLTDHKIYLQI